MIMNMMHCGSSLVCTTYVVSNPEPGIEEQRLSIIQKTGKAGSKENVYYVVRMRLTHTINSELNTKTWKE